MRSCCDNLRRNLFVISISNFFLRRRYICIYLNSSCIKYDEKILLEKLVKYCIEYGYIMVITMISNFFLRRRWRNLMNCVKFEFYN